jgi:hypothetical protein
MKDSRLSRESLVAMGTTNSTKIESKMSAVRNGGLTRIILIAACLAAVIEASLFALFEGFGRGGGAPLLIRAAGLILHLPAITIVVGLHLADPVAAVLVGFTGFLQWFLALWLAISIWNRRKARAAMTANTPLPAAADNARKLSAERAARFSCYASLAVYLLMFWWYALGGFRRGRRGDDLEVEGFLLMLCTLTLAIAFARGIVGLIGGLRRRTVGAVLFAALGLLLSALPLGFLVYTSLVGRFK